jgi:hypothetical protein
MPFLSAIELAHRRSWIVGEQAGQRTTSRGPEAVWAAWAPSCLFQPSGWSRSVLSMVFRLAATMAGSVTNRVSSATSGGQT